MISASSALNRLTTRLQNSRFRGADRRRILHGAYVDLMRPATERRPGGEFRRLMTGSPTEGVRFASGLARLMVQENCEHLVDPLNARIHQL